jgi:predicted hydrocarbon binding protein
MQITDKPEPDPIADLIMPDAYMRWALQAAEQIVGQSMPDLLRQAGLERFIGSYPANEVRKTEVTFRDYADLNAALLNIFGPTGRSTALRIGRLSARLGIEQQDAFFNVTLTTAAKMLPLPAQHRFGMEMMQAVYRNLIGQGWEGQVDERQTTTAYITSGCPMCAGKKAGQPICWIFTGVLQESVLWMTGKLFDVEQTACRAMGAPACVWEVSKVPVHA